MGVYIKNMDKPKECDLCPFADLFGICKDYCPLIDIVQCKECKRCEERTTLNGLPFLYCLKMEVSVGSDQYCYWGERRNDE